RVLGREGAGRNRGWVSRRAGFSHSPHDTRSGRSAPRRRADRAALYEPDGPRARHERTVERSATHRRAAAAGGRCAGSAGWSLPLRPRDGRALHHAAPRPFRHHLWQRYGKRSVEADVAPCRFWSGPHRLARALGERAVGMVAGQGRALAAVPCAEDALANLGHLVRARAAVSLTAPHARLGAAAVAPVARPLARASRAVAAIRLAM